MSISNAREFSGTFSIIVISPDSKLMGVAVASGSTSVGDRVPHAKPGIGIVATQAYTNVNYGTEGLELLTKGLSPKETLDRLFREDSKRNLRQVAIMDFKRRRAVFSGVDIPLYSAEIIKEDCIAIGNLLSRKGVIKDMAKQFERSNGDLALRLAKALKAGSLSGGDKRGEISAALIVISYERVEVEIKIGASSNPVEGLLSELKTVIRTT
jgi:uncharacterized Ntn-hydrolase superfamily protein